MLDGLKSNFKSYPDDTSLFSVVKSKEESSSDLTNDLDTTSKWASNWKIPFNPDLKKPLQEVLFSRKKLKYNSSSYLYQQCSGTKS